MPNINRTIVVPASLAPLARALAAGLSSGGVGMFETPLYTGTTLTHYVSSGQIDEAFGVVLADANALFAECAGAATLVQCQELVTSSIVVDCDIEDANTTFARLGLTLNGN